jgi:hypothetical protein
MQAAIGYLRVITKEQGRSGLGLAAQRFEIESFGAREGFSVKSWHQDVQTGAGADALLLRPGLAAALKEARTAHCPLIVSRLDRLSRNVHFISGLMEHRVHFVVAQLGRIATTSRCISGLASRNTSARCVRSCVRRLLRLQRPEASSLAKPRDRSSINGASAQLRPSRFKRQQCSAPRPSAPTLTGCYYNLAQRDGQSPIRPRPTNSTNETFPRRTVVVGNGSTCATLHGDWDCESGYVVGRGSRGTHAFGRGLLRSGGEREKVNRCWVFACQYTGTRP